MAKNGYIIFHLAFCPGLAQLYKGQTKKGLILLSLLFFWFGLILVYIEFPNTLGKIGHYFHIPMLIILEIYNLFDVIFGGDKADDEMSEGEKWALENRMKESSPKNIPDGDQNKKIKPLKFDNN
jgi:hypothetical protein